MSTKNVDIGANANLELVDKFCYSGDMLSVDRDADAAVENRIWIGWNKFRQLVPLLTNKDIWLIVKGRLYSSCMWNNMLHGSETWPVRQENEVALQWPEMRMVRRMCDIKVKDTVPSKELKERLGIDDIISIPQQNRWQWYGHVLWKKDCVVWSNVWSMKWRVSDQEVDQGGLGDSLCKKTVKHVNWMERCYGS